MNDPFENEPNEIKGYKFVVELAINIKDPLDTSNSSRMCVCDTREEALAEIKKDIDYNIERYKEHEITPGPYNISKIGTIVKWIDKNGKFWWWSYGIFPVKYISNK